MLGFGKTDIGKERLQNEDYIFVENNKIGILPNLYIVADGMGGHKAGAVASKCSVESFCHYIRVYNSEVADEEILDNLVSAVKYANDVVYTYSLNEDEYSNMGTTFLAAVITEERVYIAHVGDCRLYIIRDNKIAQITTDHSYVMDMLKAGIITPEEAKNHSAKNVITRAVGVEEEVQVDGVFSKIMPNDVILLCSDGLTNMLSDIEIMDIINQKDLDLEAKVDKLINTANENGGKDNISVILIG